MLVLYDDASLHFNNLQSSETLPHAFFGCATSVNLVITICNLKHSLLLPVGSRCSHPKNRVVPDVSLANEYTNISVCGIVCCTLIHILFSDIDLLFLEWECVCTGLGYANVM